MVIGWRLATLRLCVVEDAQQGSYGRAEGRIIGCSGDGGVDYGLGEGEDEGEDEIVSLRGEEELMVGWGEDAPCGNLEG